jgi:hypothetical protein
MSENAVLVTSEYEDFARDQRQKGNVTIAGVYYVATAHGNFMRFRRQPSTIDDESMEDLIDEKESLTSSRFRWSTGLGRAITAMIAGGLCFRLADTMDRCQANCTQGTLFLQDVLDHEGNYIASPRIGLYHEMIGDLRLVGELGDYDEAYNTAHKRYRNAEHDLGWSMEDDFDDLMFIVRELANSVEYEISEDTWEQIYRLSLEERIRFKREEYPHIIDRVIEDGNWDSDIF